MKLVCEACGHTEEAASVSIEAGQVVLLCAHCGHRHLLTAAPGGEAVSAPPAVAASLAMAQAEVAPEAGEPTPTTPLLPAKCPKCFHRQTRSDHCERCGLDLSRPLAEDRWETVPEGREDAYLTAVDLWHAVEAMPRSTERHEAFLTHCAESQLLEVAVRRYRSRLADRPGEQPSTAFLTESVRRMEVLALALLAADSWSEDLGRKVATARRVLVLVAAALLLLGLLLLFLLYRKQGTLIPSAL